MPALGVSGGVSGGVLAGVLVDGVVAGLLVLLVMSSKRSFGSWGIFLAFPKNPLSKRICRSPPFLSGRSCKESFGI